MNQNNNMSQKLVLYPNLILIALAIFLVIDGIATIVFNIDYSANGLLSPFSCFCIAALFLLTSLKFIVLSRGRVSVWYIVPFIRRNIDISRINTIEFVDDSPHKYLFVSFDECPSLKESKQKTAVYQFVHPFKKITVNLSGCSEQRFREYIKIAKTLYPENKISVVLKNITIAD